MAEYPIKIEGLNVSYGQTTALTDVSLALPAGQMVGVVGPNGAGKSTLIKAIVGSKTPDSGRIEIFGEPVRQGHRQVTYVPQRGAVDWDFPITAGQVVRQGRMQSVGLLGRYKRRDRQAVAQALEAVGMTAYDKRQIGALSGGQRQRVFLARALAKGGDLFLLDEPFAGVDVATEKAIVTVLRGLRDEGKTVVVVHHDLSTVRAYFDQVVLLNEELVAAGSTEVVFTPANLKKTYGGQVAIIGEGDDDLLV